MIALYIYISGQMVAGDGRGRRDADRRILLRHRFGKSGGRDRVVEQSDFGPDAFDADHRGAADGRAGRFGTGRRRGGAGRGGGGVRFLRRRGRIDAGFQGRLHSGRHAAHHPDCGADRRGGGELGDVLSALHSAGRQHQERRNGLRRSEAGRAAGGIDGGAGARASSAEKWRGRWWSPARCSASR